MITIQSLVKKDDSNSTLKYVIWLYFFLLIFEGALRKWFLPGLATPLLLVRDPVSFYLIFLGWRKGFLPINPYLLAMCAVGIVSISTALLLGHGNIFVSIYGARVLILHFFVMFVIGNTFTFEDVIKFGKVMLWLSIPMAILIALQFYSPQSAFVNRGVGGDISGAGFSGAMGYFRPPGTFSFTNGTTFFFSFLACFVFYFWLNIKSVNFLALIGSTLALISSVPLSISRSLLFSVIICCLFTFFAILVKPKYLKKMAGVLVGLMMLLIVLLQTSFFQTSLKAFTQRFETASSHEGGLEGTLVDRYLGDTLGALDGRDGLPFFGYGIGLGTNVAAVLTTGKRTFLFAEGEWPRIIGELGLFMGLIVIFIRLGLCINIALISFTRLKQGNLLPWILLSFALLIIPQGQWAQPTSLGFSTMVGGIIIASLKKNDFSE